MEEARTRPATTIEESDLRTEAKRAKTAMDQVAKTAGFTIADSEMTEPAKHDDQSQPSNVGTAGDEAK